MALDAKMMLDELLSSELSVILIPAPEPKHSGHQIRAVESQNCQWYREFCSLYASQLKRKTRFNTKIKRELTINALTKIIGGNKQGIYVERLLSFIKNKNLIYKPRRIKSYQEEMAEYEENWKRGIYF